MASRRNLIVVSNRGPVTFNWSGGERVARRGGGGLVTALRSLVAPSRRHVDRERDVRRGSRCRFGQQRRGVRGDRPRRLDLPLAARSRTTSRRTTGSTTSSPTRCCGSSSTTSGISRLAPSIDHGVHHAWLEGYVPVNRAFADAVIDELERDPRRVRLLPRLPPLRRAADRARRAARTRGSSHFVHIPWPRPTTGRAAARDPARDSRRPARERRRRLSHAPLAAQLHPRGRGRRRRGARLGARLGRLRRPADRRHRVADLGRPGRVRRARAQRRPCSARGASSSRNRPEKLVLRVDRTDPSKNIVRGFRAFELYLDAHPEMHRRVGMLALLDPSRQEIPEYAEYLGRDPARGAPRQRPLPARRLGADRPPDRATTSRERSPPTSSSTCCS